MPGLHLDVRRSHVVGSPATWGAVKDPSAEKGQRYVSVDEALRAAP